MTLTSFGTMFIPTIEDALRYALRIIRSSAQRIDIQARNARIVVRHTVNKTLQELA